MVVTLDPVSAAVQIRLRLVPAQEAVFTPATRIYLMPMSPPQAWGPPAATPAIFPAPGKVRAGEVFGPGGADYTGTEILPAVADVRTGTGFGAGGSEYTGTLAAGAGGISRGRAVN